jgi:outer membrane immunogenic protein
MRVCSSATGSAAASTETATEAITTDGWYGGAFAGYNLQHDMFVYGVEGDINYSQFRGSNAAGDAEPHRY